MRATMPGSAPARSRQAGFTMLEMSMAFVLLAALLAMLGTALLSLVSVLGRAVDEEATFLRAASALVRIKEELSSAVQDPAGITASPSYAVSATSVTFRTPVGVARKTDPGYDALVEAGRVSTAGLLYAPYARTISFDAVAHEVRLSVTGTIPIGMPATEVLARDVAEFAFYDGESRTSPPAAPRNDSWVLGCRIVLRRASTAPQARGEAVDSNVDGAVLSVKIAVLPETLINKRAKPEVGTP